MKASLKTKLAMGFAGVLGLMVVVGGIGVHSVRDVSKDAEEMAHVHGRLNTIALDIKARNNAARRFEKEFLISYGEVGVAAARDKYGNAVLAEVEAMKRTAGDGITLARDEQERERFRAIVRAADAYGDDFTGILRAVEKRGSVDTGAEGEFRNAIHTVENKLKSFKEPDHIMVPMLSLRRSEKDYLLRGDEKYVAAVSAGVDKFKAAVDQEPAITVGDRAGLKELADRYQHAFQQLVDAERSVAKTLKAPDAASAELGRAAQAAADGAMAANEAALAAAVSESRATMSMVALVSLIGLALGSLLSALLSRAIVRPIRYLTDVAEKVSLGDTDLAVSRQTEDEIGDLAESFGRLVASVKVMRTAMGDTDDRL